MTRTINLCYLEWLPRYIQENKILLASATNAQTYSLIVSNCSHRWISATLQQSQIRCQYLNSRSKRKMERQTNGIMRLVGALETPGFSLPQRKPTKITHCYSTLIFFERAVFPQSIGPICRVTEDLLIRL